MSTFPIKPFPLPEPPALDSTRNLVILTGAGISAESGLKTFRDAGGLWEGHRVEDVATPQAFMRQPDVVHSFYNARRHQLSEVEPNAAHTALAELEHAWKGDFLLITQNVDNLHERAGSQNLLHMHGELAKARCARTQKVVGWTDEMTVDTACPCCNKAGNLRPHIVWFGEVPLEMERIAEALADCDYFMAIGTSGLVYPAAGFCYEAKAYGATTMELTLEPSGNPAFDCGLQGPASQTVPSLLQNLN